jgi:hypothetical protein
MEEENEVQNSGEVTPEESPVIALQEASTDSQELKSNKKIIIIISTIVSFIVIITSFFLWQKVIIKETDEVSNEAQLKNIVNEEEQQLNNEETKEEEIYIYSLEEIQDFPEVSLAMILPCYLNSNLDLLEYFADELKFWTEGFLGEEFCSRFELNREASLYLETAIKTDTDNDGLNDLLELMYYTDKTKTDTDNDGYDDLTEVMSMNDPNNILTEQDNAFMILISEEFEKNDPNVDIISSSCLSLSRKSRQFDCLELASRHETIVDLSFCDDIQGVNTEYLKNSCIDNILKQQANESNNVDECLKLSGEMEKFSCLNDFMIKNHTLEPCEIAGKEKFTTCISASYQDVFAALENNNDCYKYKDWFKFEREFNSCLEAVAVTNKDFSFCFEDFNNTSNCINSMTMQLGLPKQCVYHLINPVAVDKGYSFSTHFFIRCIEFSNKEISEEEIKNIAIQGCSELDISKSSIEEGHAIFIKDSCISELAKHFEDPSLCDYDENKDVCLDMYN